MINPFYLSDDFVVPFSTAFRSRSNAYFPPYDSSVNSAVFPIAVWPSFLHHSDCVNLREELAKMKFVLRSSDLYEFHQTVDLKHVNPKQNPFISNLCNELYSKEFLRVMERITGRKLGSHVDISGQRYQQGDFLLCHDDRLEKRRIALILYLVDQNEIMKGGRLFALRSDEEGCPVMDSPQTVTPEWNTLAFFEVSRISFHQVEQVFSEKVPRYSITCWFHDEEKIISISTQNPFTSSIFPIKFACPFDLSDLLSDFLKLSRPVYRQYVNGSFLSSAQYTESFEPHWISSLLTDSFHRFIEKISGFYLDWPTKPVAWCLSSPDHFYLQDGQADRQQDVEYNYKERTVILGNPVIKLYLSIFLRFNCDGKPMKPFIKLHLDPLRISKLSKKYSKILFVSMRFNKSQFNLRTIE